MITSIGYFVMLIDLLLTRNINIVSYEMKTSNHRSRRICGLVTISTLSFTILLLPCSSSGITRQQLTSRSTKNLNTLELLTLRGGLGSSHIEYNPNYVHPSGRPMTLGDLEENNDFGNNRFGSSSLHSYDPTFSTPRKPTPLTQLIHDYFVNLRRNSPSLYYGTVSSLVMFVLWQIPQFSSILRGHFICSRQNVLKKKRFHALLLSAISHASFSHLAINMYAFSTFGSSVQRILKGYGTGFSLWPFCIGAALLGNIFFMLLTPNGSCLGLSGVTLALLALDAKVHPGKQLGMVVHFIPIRLPAQYALAGIFAMSLCGVLGSLVGSRVGDGVAHATHLGGLVFGLLYYEALARGILSRYRIIFIRWWYKVFGKL